MSRTSFSPSRRSNIVTAHGRTSTYSCTLSTVHPHCNFPDKDIFKTIISHSGMLIREKITFHRKAKPVTNQITRQLSSYRSYTQLSDLRVDASESGSPPRKSTESMPTMEYTPSIMSMRREGAGYLPGLHTQRRAENEEEKSGGIFNNALTRHLKDISHLARHRDGISGESEESTLRKTKMLFGKFVGNNR
jgi:hypothetical protein